MKWQVKNMNYNSIKTELSGDLISRDAVLKEINCWIGSGEYRYAMSERFLLDRIKQLPSVTLQEPKTGHWIGHREHCENLGAMPSGLGAYEWCSNCDCGIDVREWHMNNYNYCPNCGCRMIKPQESEDKE